MKFEQNPFHEKQNIEEEKREIPKTETETKEEQERASKEEVMRELDKIIESQDEKIRPILRENLELMTGTERNEMMGILMRESMGGNAGEYKNFLCVAANFYFDKNTGEISEFSNYPIENKDLVSGTFRLACALTGSSESWSGLYFKIIDKILSKEGNDDAKKTIEQSVDLYNQRHILNQEKIISKVKSIDELVQNLGKIGVVEGRSGFYSPQELENIINKVRRGESKLTAITRAVGLRDKVAEFIGVRE